MIYKKLCDLSSAWLEQFSGFVVTVVLALTGADVIGRAFGAPVPGTYELVQFMGGLIVGLPLPMSYRSNKQVKMDFEIESLPIWLKRLLESITRLLSIGLFGLLSYGLIELANDQRTAGEITPILSLPFYYVTYGMSVGILIVALVLVCEEIEIWRSDND